MTKKRKPRTGPEEKAKVAQAAFRQIECVHVDLTKEKEIFDEIIDERPKADWSDHMITFAGLLAKLVYSAAQDPKSVNFNQIISARRSLGLHSLSRDGDLRDKEKRTQLGKQAENSVKELVNIDSLLAGHSLIN